MQPPPICSHSPASDWSMVITWPGYWPLIGPSASHSPASGDQLQMLPRPRPPAGEIVGDSLHDAKKYISKKREKYCRVERKKMKQTQSREWGLSERHINNPGDSPDVTGVTTRLTSGRRDIVTSRVRSGECHPELRLSFVVWLHQVRSVIVRRRRATLVLLRHLSLSPFLRTFIQYFSVLNIFLGCVSVAVCSGSQPSSEPEPFNLSSSHLV